MSRIRHAAVLLLLLSSSTAHAQDDADRARAKALVDRGNTAFREGRHDEAIAHFEAAIAAFDSPKIHVNLAEVYRARGDFADAMRHYEVFVARGVSSPRVMSKIQARIAEVESKIGRVELDGIIADATVRIGDWSVPWRSGRRLPVDPGEVVAVVQRSGEDPDEHRLDVATGDVVKLTLEADVPSTPPIDLNARAAPTSPALVATTDGPKLTEEWWFWTAIGVVVVVVGVSVVAATTGGDDYLPSGELMRTRTSDWSEL